MRQSKQTKEFSPKQTKIGPPIITARKVRQKRRFFHQTQSTVCSGIRHSEQMIQSKNPILGHKYHIAGVIEGKVNKQHKHAKEIKHKAKSAKNT